MSPQRQWKFPKIFSKKQASRVQQGYSWEKCHHVTAQYFALNKRIGHQVSVNQLKWRLDCKWSAAKVQICSWTLLPDQNLKTCGAQTAAPEHERSWLWLFLREISPWYQNPIMTTVTKTPRLSASICKHPFPRKSWKRACLLLAICFPRPCDAGQRNATRMQEQIEAQQIWRHAWTQSSVFWRCGCLWPRMGVSSRA